MCNTNMLVNAILTVLVKNLHQKSTRHVHYVDHQDLTLPYLHGFTFTIPGGGWRGQQCHIGFGTVLLWDS